MASTSRVNSGSGLDVLAATASNERRLSSMWAAGLQLQQHQQRTKSRDVAEANDDDYDSPSQACETKTAGGLRRKGKWTAEEEEYATRFIHFFSTGLLSIPDGKTLRSSLAEKLSCDPMRITKKFAGASCLGKKINSLIECPDFSQQDVEMAMAELAHLERRFKQRLEYGVGVPLPHDDGKPRLAHQPLQMKHPTPQAVIPTNTASAAQVAPAQQPHSHQNVPNAANYLTQLANNAQLALLAAAGAQTIPSTAHQVVTTQASAQQVVQIPQLTQHQQPMPGQQLPNVTSESTNALLAQQGLGSSQNVNLLNGLSTTPSIAMTAPGILPQIFQNVSQNLALTAPSTGNDQLVRTLVLQVTTQLQALSTLSPSTLRQIQLQILGLGQTTQAAAVPTSIPTSTRQTSLVALPMLQEPAIVVPQLQPQGPTNASLTNPGASLLANLQASIAVQQRPAYTGVANVNLNNTAASPALPQANVQSPSSQHSCLPPAQPQVAQPDANNLLAQLRKKHAEALEMARQTAVEHQIQPSTASLASETSRHIAKKQRVTTNVSANNSAPVFLPLEQATAVSTASNSTSQTSDFQTGDEAQGQASLSEYDDYDDEEDDGVDYSLPLRKRRFQDATGPITQQNLAAHDRMQQQYQMNNLG